MIITVGAVALNTLLGFFLVLGISPFPKLGVLGAGVATLLSQTVRCLVLLVAIHRRRNGPRWRWPWQHFGTATIVRKLLAVTYPLALSEMLWGASAFGYTLVFTRLGTAALASSQIVMVIENLFIAVAAGLAPAGRRVHGFEREAHNVAPPGRARTEAKASRVHYLAGQLCSHRDKPGGKRCRNFAHGHIGLRC